MARIQQTKEDMELQLKHQISFLIASCLFYDKGTHHEAKRIATVLRTLFHRTKSCKPLLGQMKLDTLSWLNTADPHDPDNLVSHLGLTSIKFTPGRLPCLIPKGTPTQCNKLNFNTWWSRPAVVAVAGTEKLYFSRQQLVLNVAETDGGAHVDSGLDEIYNDLSRKNGLGLNAIVNGKKYPILYPELPCLRQIAHEVLVTLWGSLPELFDEQYNDEIHFTPFGLVIDDVDSAAEIGFELFIRKGNA